MITMYRGYEIIEEQSGKQRVFVYASGSSGDAKPDYIADDWDDLDIFINANPASQKKPATERTDTLPSEGDAAAELAGIADHLASESVILAMEIAEALGIDRHTFLDADGPDAIVEAIEALRAENAAARSRIASAHVMFTLLNDMMHDFDDGHGVIGVNYVLGQVKKIAIEGLEIGESK